MALDDRQVQRTADEAVRSVERMQAELRNLNKRIYGMGSDFRNDRRFSADAYRLRDEVTQLDRDIQQVRDRMRTIQRNAR